MKKIFKLSFVLILSLIMQQARSQEIPVWKLKDLKTAMQSDKPTILNFWATFCKPCIEEMPHFQEMAKKYKDRGVELIFVSLDMKEMYPKKIQAFLTKRKVADKVVFLDETDADLFCPAVSEKWSGAIPATIFINNKKGYSKFFEEQLTKEQLEREIKSLLGTQK